MKHTGLFAWSLVLAATVTLTPLISGCSKPAPTPPPAPPRVMEDRPPLPAPPTTTVDELDVKIDPVCEMDMAKYAITDTLMHEGKRYGFCSSYCKEAFEKEPAKYPVKAETETKTETP